VTVSYIVAAMCEIVGITHEEIVKDFEDVSNEQKLLELDTVVEKIFAMEWNDSFKVASQTK